MESYGKPRSGSDTYRIGDSDDLVLMENVGILPPKLFYTENYGIIILCTEGIAQLEYNGATIQLEKDDLFLYMVQSVATKFRCSPDFNCKMIWFSRSALWDINRHSNVTINDFSTFKLQPKVHLGAADHELFNTYFKLLSCKMSEQSRLLYEDIARSLWGTMLLELLSIFRSQVKEDVESTGEEDVNASLHKKHLVDSFIKMVEQSDGRIRRVDEFSSQMNITPKYLSTIMKEVMNQRPSFIIQHFTLKAIEYRLRYTDMTMQEISNDLNFPNPSFFGKYFREHTGMTRMEYRVRYHTGVLKTKNGEK